MNSIYVTFDELNPNSGAGKVCIHEIKALAKATNLELALCRAGTLENYPVKNLNIDKVYGFNPFLYDYFMANQTEGNIDLLHLSCSPGIALLNKLRPIKSVCNIVAHDLQTSIVEHERIYGQPYPFIHNVDIYLKNVLRKHANLVDIVFCPSSGSKEWIKNNLNAKRIEVIPHGCDYPEIPPELPTDKLRIGYTGAGGPDKGLLYLIMAWKSLGYKDAELVFAGTCCDEAKSWASQICPEANIKYLGYVEKIEDFYKEVNAVIAPSVSEGFGLIVIEGPAHGRCVISTTGTAARDVLDKHASIIAEPRNPGQLAESIAYLHDNLDEVKKMGKEARNQAKEYKWKNIEDRYIKIYEELIN